MDAADRLLSNDRAVAHQDLDEDKLLLNAKPSGVKCDIVNECKVFLKAEDGGGDAQLSATGAMVQERPSKISIIMIMKIFFIVTL